MTLVRRPGTHQWAKVLVVAFGLVGGSFVASAMDHPPRPKRLVAPPLRRNPPVVPAPSGPSPFQQLPPLRLCTVNTKECVAIALYDASGYVDPTAASRLDQLLADYRDPKRPATVRLDRRVLQLVYRAAYHFNDEQVEVVSAYRRPGRRREGPHALGMAVDFKLPGVTAAALASYLRTLPRVGVGVYTHPRTQYVHLDVREPSYHWIDASPPNRTWRERPIRARNLAALDATYTLKSDWPEGTSPPP